MNEQTAGGNSQEILRGNKSYLSVFEFCRCICVKLSLRYTHSHHTYTHHTELFLKSEHETFQHHLYLWHSWNLAPVVLYNQENKKLIFL